MKKNENTSEYNLFDSEDEKDDFKMVLSELILAPLKEEITTEIKSLVKDVKDKQEKMAITVEKNANSLSPLIEVMSDFGQGLEEFQTTLQNLQKENQENKNETVTLSKEIFNSNEQIQIKLNEAIEKIKANTELLDKVEVDRGKVNTRLTVLTVINILFVMILGIIVYYYK